MDNFAFVKGTEVRNLLFYGLLPHLDSALSNEQYGHLAMYICGVRLLHSGNLFGDATSTIARRLFSQFHQDHELYYNRLQSFKLHMHCHYASMFESHGSLCNLGCFGQESFIGSISDNHHGTRYYGDSIAYYYNLDFFIQDKKKEAATEDGPYDRSSTLASTCEFIDRFHTDRCDCGQLNSCCTTYDRYSIDGNMFHSERYSKRKSSVSYFVQFTLDDDQDHIRFGSIQWFFICQGIGHAVIQCHRTASLYSDCFKNSPYYHILREPVDRLYFLLEKVPFRDHIVRTDSITNHCVIVEKNDHLFTSSILSYDEHD